MYVRKPRVERSTYRYDECWVSVRPGEASIVFNLDSHKIVVGFEIYRADLAPSMSSGCTNDKYHH